VQVLKNVALALLALAVAAAILIVVVVEAPTRSGGGRPPLRSAPRGERHRIGVRVSVGLGEFIDRQTGRKFVPRGANYVRLAPQRTDSGARIVYHSTFNVGTYGRQRAETTLERMRSDGYNTVRVFLDPACTEACLGDAKTGRISSAYVANVVDFLRRARSNHVEVLLTIDGVPTGGQYAGLLATAATDRIASTNINFLSEGGVEANIEFWEDFVSELNVQRAPLVAILGYELRNELVFARDKPPLTLRSGTLRTADGRTYSLGTPSERQRMLDANVVDWIDRVRTAIRRLDPTALVGIGFGEPDSAARAAIDKSNADFVDVHSYPGVSPSLGEVSVRLGPGGPGRRPLLMGEYGAFKSVYPSPRVAARALAKWQYESCRDGFTGWLLWTWDTDEQPSLWTALSASAVIGRTLSPKVRPNPCLPSS
jgi:endo-1,4-beta-mannosidase